MRKNPETFAQEETRSLMGGFPSKKPRYQNSVSYGRWHASLPVSRAIAPSFPADDNDVAGTDQILHESGARENSHYFAASVVNPPGTLASEFGFEALRKATTSRQNMGKQRMTTNAASCLAHLNDIRRLNQIYFGEELDVLKGFIPKEPLRPVDYALMDLKHAPACSADVRALTLRMKRPLPSGPSATVSHMVTKAVAKEMRILDKPLPVVERELPDNDFHREFGNDNGQRQVQHSQPFMPSSRKDHGLEYTQSDGKGTSTESLYFPKTNLAKNPVAGAFRRTENYSTEHLVAAAVHSKKKLDRTGNREKQTGTKPTGTTEHILWGAPAVSTKVDKMERATLTFTPIAKLAELAESSDFVFSPKYADSLRNLPELRHKVILSNSLPLVSGGLTVTTAAPGYNYLSR